MIKLQKTPSSGEATKEDSDTKTVLLYLRDKNQNLVVCSVASCLIMLKFVFNKTCCENRDLNICVKPAVIYWYDI